MFIFFHFYCTRFPIFVDKPIAKEAKTDNMLLIQKCKLNENENS